MEIKIKMALSDSGKSRKDGEIMKSTKLVLYLRYPYSPPGYESTTKSENDVFVLDISTCPAYDYFKAHGEEELALNSWCKQDFALAQIMTEGGSYERPHTLAAGDNVCDMRWYGRPRSKEAQQSRDNP